MKATYIALFVTGVACALNAYATTLVADSFTGTNAPGWVFTASQGSGAILTAQESIDPYGEGWLRLAQDTNNQSTFVYYDTPIPTKDGLIFIFDFVIWSSKPSSGIGDGFALTIFNADEAVPSAGGYGGSLGYSKRSGIPGMAGGIVGFGFDVFGNFSNPTEGREGGPGRVENAIALRGSMGATRNEGYEYQTGTGSLTNFSTSLAASRDDATVHRVRISMTSQQVVRVEWRPEGGGWSTLIPDYACTLNCPEEVKFGFTAGTGSTTAHFEVRHLEVIAIPEPTLGLAVFALCVWCARAKRIF